MLYIALSESRRSTEIITAARNLPILTVGEPEDFINAGGMIRFTESGHRIKFQINPDAAERASLKVSSRLLRLADIVRPRRASGQ
jgi:preprotein translocase subunit Sec61beta